MAISNTYQIISCSADLVQPGQNVELWGSVIAVFPLCIYVKSTTNKIVCIADKALDDGPGRLRADFLTPPISQVKDGDLVTTLGTNLYLGDVAIIRTDRAEIWSPPSVSSLGSLDEILSAMRCLSSKLEKDIPKAGLSSVLIWTEDLVNGVAPDQYGCDIVVSRSILGLKDLVIGWSTADRDRISRGVAQLIGLGPGLTPSGDDLLAGMLIALKQIQKINPEFVGNAATEMLASEIAGHACTGTNAISSEMLCHAIKGNSICSVHCLLIGLLDSRSSSKTTKFARDLVSIGHTSGWDMLAGIFLGLHLGLHKVNIATSTAVGASDLFRGASWWTGRVVES
ncbi:DUF2877 domain-containing protein [SAR202 cluster bacterium AD-804-J14_MRT_500m]|nr:DUF2877 domain-containing protein [SAR202 cluster bacterium AD-804-J14_MRT_500m]